MSSLETSLPKNKNIGSFLAFTKEWFEQRQTILLWFLNAPVIKHWARWILRITPQDCPKDIRISRIMPSYFAFNRRYIRQNRQWVMAETMDFRCHPKFAKRIYYAFRPVWWAMHYWDLLFADRFAPKLSFGFSTLTAFPSPGTTSPMDGEMTWWPNAPTAWATIRGAASAGYVSYQSSTDLSLAVSAHSVSNAFVDISRMIMNFDTSALGAGATITAVVASLRGEIQKQNGLGSTPIHVAGATPASTNTLVVGDYSQVSRTSFGNVTYAAWSISAYNDFTLNASGIANVNKTGVSSFSVQFGFDIDNTPPTWVSMAMTQLYICTSDQTGTTNDPKLVVTYTAPVNYVSTLTDNLTLTASVTNLYGQARQFLETLTITETITRAMTRVFSEAVTITAFVFKTLPSLVYNEAISLTESFQTLTVSLLTLVENISITDFFSRAITKIYEETISITETVTTEVQRFITAATETLTLADTILKAIGKTFLETITVSTSQFVVLVNGIVTGIWRKVGRLPGIWRKINRKDN